MPVVATKDHIINRLIKDADVVADFTKRIGTTKGCWIWKGKRNKNCNRGHLYSESGIYYAKRTI